MPWADSHCHLPWEGIEPAAAIRDAHAAGVARLITVGTDAAQSRAAIAVAEQHDEVFATVGLHPHDAVQGVETIVELLGHEKVVGVGECGLDYHYDHSPRDVQRAVFAAQVGLAHAHGLALVIHTREAWDDTFAILRSEGTPARTVFHCFTGGPDEAERSLELGACLSFSGIITFKSAEDIRSAARVTPSDRILVETDTPYLTPVPFRGQENRPALVPVVGAALAAALTLEAKEVESATWLNTARVFGLPNGLPPP